MQNTLDKHTGSAVFVGQVALNPRVLRRNLTEIQVFLRPQYERTVGCGGNTTPACREYPRRSLARFKTPGSLDTAKLEKLRRTTMQPYLLDALRLLSLLHDISPETAKKHATTIADLLIQAEHACYQARICVFNPIQERN